MELSVTSSLRALVGTVPFNGTLEHFMGDETGIRRFPQIFGVLTDEFGRYRGFKPIFLEKLHGTIYNKSDKSSSRPDAI